MIFIALLEIDKKPMMRELNEKINEVHGLLQNMGDVPNAEEFRAILKILMDERMALRKKLFMEYVQQNGGWT